MAKKKLTLKSLQAELNKILKRIDILEAGNIAKQFHENLPNPEPKKEDDIWFEGNYVTYKDKTGLFYVTNNGIRTLIDGETDNDYAHTGMYFLPFKQHYIQAPDSMIFDYLMKPYREKGWKEGCRFEREDLFKEMKTGTVKKFILVTPTNIKECSVRTQDFYREGKYVYMIGIKERDLPYGSVVNFPIDECTLLSEKLMFDGEEVRIDFANKLAYIHNFWWGSLFLKKWINNLIPERQKELQAIIDKLENK